MKLNKIKSSLLILISLLSVSCSSITPTSGCSGSCTDDEINTAVQVKIAADRCMSDQFIKVTTYDRIVTLKGRVSNPTQKRIASQMAESVPRVRYVKNQLAVKPMD